MEVRLLGPLEVNSSGGPLSLAGTKQRIVLALLALRIGQVVSNDELIEAGWGEDLPANPPNALQYQVAQLRKLLGDEAANPHYLVTAKPGYRLQAETVTTDVQSFQTELTSARQAFHVGHLDQADSSATKALALWRGPALAEFRYDDFSQGDAERLDDERLAAIELKLDVALAEGRHAEVAPQLTTLTIEHPLREGLWERRARALSGSGRQSEALRALQEARDALGDVGLEPGGNLLELERRIVEQDQSLIADTNPAAPTILDQGREPALTPHVLPPPVFRSLPAPPNRLIGRQREVEEVQALLESGRLVTLVGPGGAGKTRLAIAVGHALVQGSSRRVCFVALDALDDQQLLAAAIGRATGMRENPERPVLETLVDHLGSGETTLILDNCEHIVESIAELVTTLLARCDRLSVLATSQATLDVAGEAVFTVSPLAVPGRTASIYDPITDIDAVVLFLDRAREAGAPVERWNDADMAAVANIVTALDGMPLALELAAARTRSMALEEIATGLDDRFAILSRGPRTAPDRQRSLLGVVEWSLSLLTDQQRSLMAKLSVFVGGFRAEDAAAITGLSLPIIRDELAELVDRSLLYRIRDVAGSARFMMFESLRQHGELQLGEGGLASMRDIHLRHFADFVTQAGDGVRSSDQVDWLHRLDAAQENIRAALAWSLAGGSAEIGLEMAGGLGRYWDWRGLLKEGSSWAERLIAEFDQPVPALPSVRAWNAFMAWEFGDLEKARREHDLATKDAVALGDPVEIASVLSIQVLLSRSDGDLDAARSHGLATKQAAEQSGDTWFATWAESGLAVVALAAGDLTTAETHARRTTEQFAALGDRRGEGWGLISLAQIALDRGDLASAESNGRAALEASTVTEDHRNVLWALEVLADAAHRQGDLERSARLWGAALPLRDSRGLTESVSKLTKPNDLGSILANALGDRFDALVAEGRSDPSTVIAAER